MATAKKTAVKKTAHTRTKKKVEVQLFQIEKVKYFGLKRELLPTVYDEAEVAKVFADTLNASAPFLTYYAPIYVGTAIR